jgi:Uma2 family endonuclease
MSKPAERLADYSHLLSAPPHLIAELIAGVLHTQPRPAPRHARAGSSLGVCLGGPFDHGRDGPGGWWILDEPECHLGADVLVPDLAGWRRSRMPELPDAAWFELAPDWVCEVLSPCTARHDRVRKLPIYARHGVGYLWLVDPDQLTLEAYRLSDGHWLLLTSHAEDDVVRAAPFEAVEFDLGKLWA